MFLYIKLSLVAMAVVHVWYRRHAPFPCLGK